MARKIHNACPVMATFLRNPRTAEEVLFRHMSDKAPVFVWKRFQDGVCLRVRVYAPPGHTAEDFAPAVVFFFGGMWTLEYSEEFVSWAIHLARRGIVCLLPEYRTHSRYEVKADDIVEDGLDMWKWVHHNASGLGIDRDRITLAGSDAGGVLALNAAMQPMIREKRWWQWRGEDELPLMPACVAIFRGVIDVLAPEARFLNVAAEVSSPNSINPCALLRRKLPPLFCAHGMLDPLLDYEMREWFCEEWRRMGNVAELVLCPAGDHTLTHFEVNPAVFEQILLAWQTFMVQQGIWPENAMEFDALME